VSVQAVPEPSGRPGARPDVFQVVRGRLVLGKQLVPVNPWNFDQCVIGSNR
jgi:hypothetical protein